MRRVYALLHLLNPKWLPLFEIANSYHTVYKWFDYPRLAKRITKRKSCFVHDTFSCSKVVEINEEENLKNKNKVALHFKQLQ